MANDVTLNSMTGGAVVATDQVTDGSHVQIVRLAYSAEDSRTPITADTNGLKVNVGNTVTVTLGSALPAGSNVIGAVTQSGTWNVVASGTVAATQSGAWTVAATQSGTWNIGSITTLPSLPAGSNVIGAVTQSGTWNIGSITTLPSIPAGSNLIGSVNVNNASLNVTATQSAGPWTVVERGASIDHASTTVTTTQVSLISAGTTRRSVTIQNLGTDYIWIGKTGITVGNGLRVSPGQTAVIDKSPNAQIFAIASSGTQSVSLFWESD